MALSTFADGRLWGARYGSGRPWALALHGWARDHHDFATLLGGMDAIALDLPGFGVAPEPPEAWSTAEYAAHVAGVLEDMADGELVVVGHSFGARVAVHLAGMTGQRGAGASPRVGALVLVGAPLAPPPGAKRRARSRRFGAARALHRAGLVSDERMEAFRRRYGAEDYRRASPVMRGVLVQAIKETAAAGYVPLLRDWAARGGQLELLWGEQDKEASVAGARACLSSTPEVVAKVVVVPGAGHLLTSPLAAEVRAALLRHRPPSSPAEAL